jgi:sugar phosphate isomerase/epimerase
MPGRRSFLEVTGGAALAALGARSAAATPGATPPHVGSAAAAAGTRTFCFFSKHLPDLAWGDLAAATIDMGFEGIDLTVRPKGHVLPERVADDLPRAIDAIRAKGSTVSMITTELTSASHPTAEAIFAAAAKTGVRLIKVGYWKYALQDVRAEVAGMGRDLAGLAALAKRHGLTIGVHNHQGNIGAALWDIAPHLEPLDPEAIGYYFDPRHAVVEGGGGAWKAATRLVLPRLKMIAVKDALWAKGPKGWVIENCPMGEGMVDWAWFATAIAPSAFTGPISLHLEYKIAGTTPDEVRRNTMQAARRDLAFITRQFAGVAAEAGQ